MLPDIGLFCGPSIYAAGWLEAFRYMSRVFLAPLCQNNPLLFQSVGLGHVDAGVKGRWCLNVLTGDDRLESNDVSRTLCNNSRKFRCCCAPKGDGLATYPLHQRFLAGTPPTGTGKAVRIM